MDEQSTVTPQLYSVADAMRLLNVGRTTLYSLIASGKLRAVKLGRRTLIPASAIAALIDELQRKAA